MPRNPRRALIVGCPRRPLLGVHHSIAVLRAALALHGFHCEVVPSADAATLTAALRAFIDATVSGDIVVIVYIGHGELYERVTPGTRDSPPTGTPRYVQALLPIDSRASTPESCKVITGFDLAPQLDELRRRARDVTLIFDCCHAGDLATPRMVDPAVHTYFQHSIGRQIQARHGRVMRGQAEAVRRGQPELDAVRLVASSAFGKAFEVPWGPDGDERIGAFSLAVAESLTAAVGCEVAWCDIAAAVHGKLSPTWDCNGEAGPAQWSGAEGPHERAVFAAIIKDLPVPPHGCPIARARDGSLMIPVALDSYVVGDVVAIVDPAGHVHASTHVAETAAGWGRLALAGDRLAVAFPRAVRQDPAACHRVDDPHGVADRIAELPREWSTREGQPVARLEQQGPVSHLYVAPQAQPIASVPSDDPHCGPHLRAGLTRITAMHRMQRAFETALWRPQPNEFTVTLLDRNGRPLAAAAHVAEDDEIVVKAHHRGALWTLLHCAVFRVRADLVIDPITADTAHGIPVQMGDEPTTLATIPLRWPAVDRSFGPREESLLFVVYDQPLHVRCLATAIAALPPVRDVRGPVVRGPGLERPAIVRPGLRCHRVTYKLAPRAADEPSR